MDTDKLADDLLEKRPEEWPAQLRSLRETDVRMPDTTRALLKNQINAAKARRFRRVIVQRVAAAAILVVGVGTGAWLWLGRQGSETLHLVATRGAGIQVAGKQAAAGSQHRLRTGQNVQLPRGASMVVALGALAVEVRGPSRFSIEGQKKAGYRFVTPQAAQVVAYSDPGAEHAPVEFHFGGSKVRITGTMVTLASGAPGQLPTVQVLEGSVHFTAGARSTTIRKGQALDSKSGETLRVRPLRPAERSRLVNQKTRIKRMRAGRPVIDAGLRLHSESRIAAHYGTLHRVMLADGREYRGFAVRAGSVVRVHTTTNVISLEAASVQSIQRTKADEGDAE